MIAWKLIGLTGYRLQLSLFLPHRKSACLYTFLKVSPKTLSMLSLLVSFRLCQLFRLFAVNYLVIQAPIKAVIL